VISHRGAAAIAPENSLLSITAAMQLGAKNIEVDVQRSADGVLVLIHDNNVDRITDGSGFVRDLTWDELSKLNSTSQLIQDRSFQPIPRLRDALDAIKGEGVELVVEVKKPYLYPGIENQLSDVIRDSDALNQVSIISFDHEWLENSKLEVPLGKLYFWTGSLEASSKYAFIDVHWSNIILDPTLVYRIHKQGFKAVAWTANNLWLIKILHALGVDGITTDNPAQWNIAIDPISQEHSH